jgi:hypothetical protein
MSYYLVHPSNSLPSRSCYHDTSQLRQLYRHYATTSFTASELGGGAADGASVSVSASARQQRRGSVGGGGGGTGVSSPLLASFEDCRRLLAEWDVIPQIIDIQVLPVQHKYRRKLRTALEAQVDEMTESLRR